MSYNSENQNWNNNKQVGENSSPQKNKFVTKNHLNITTWHFNNRWDVIGATFCNLAMFKDGFEPSPTPYFKQLWGII